MSNQSKYAREKRRMAEWIRKYGHHPSVQLWIKKNPPPPEWRGTAEHWAYTEMPVPSAMRR